MRDYLRFKETLIEGVEFSYTPIESAINIYIELQ